MKAKILTDFQIWISVPKDGVPLKDNDFSTAAGFMR